MNKKSRIILSIILMILTFIIYGNLGKTNSPYEFIGWVSILFNITVILVINND